MGFEGERNAGHIRKEESELKEGGGEYNFAK